VAHKPIDVEKSVFVEKEKTDPSLTTTDQNTVNLKFSEPLTSIETKASVPQILAQF
jgi:hypothetical protein